MNGSGPSGNSGCQYSRTETLAGVTILVCLLAVGVVVFLKQYSFNPAVLAAVSAEGRKTQTSGPPPANTWFAPELKEFGPPETFSPDNLYDKIDGKAELYLSAGFVRLNCRRFALKDAPDQWLEWFVYDMGTVAQAFSVFTVQRRAEAQTLDLAEYAYQTQNSIYFVCGSNYVEAVASAASAPLLDAMRSLARRFIAASPSGGTHVAQLELLPAENLVSGSQTLQSADVFGFDRFKNVYTAEYKVGDASVLGFVMSCANADAAQGLRDAYAAFLIENGGRPLAGRAAEHKPIEILGGIEIVFSEGAYVAGVHAAPRVDAAEQVATQLRRRLAKKAK
jgi:hypothetical protein